MNKFEKDIMLEEKESKRWKGELLIRHNVIFFDVINSANIKRYHSIIYFFKYCLSPQDNCFLLLECKY